MSQMFFFRPIFVIELIIAEILFAKDFERRKLFLAESRAFRYRLHRSLLSRAAESRELFRSLFHVHVFVCVDPGGGRNLLRRAF